MNSTVLTILIIIAMIVGIIIGSEIKDWSYGRKIHRIVEAKVEARLEASEKRSGVVKRGKVLEQLIPFVGRLPGKLEEMRFLGSPVDYVTFAGLNDGIVPTIWIIEVKTGNSQLSEREKLVRSAVRDRKIKYLMIRIERNGNIITET